MKMSKKEKTVLTKTQKRSLFRWFLNGGASLNYERMMSMAYTYSMLPWLKENYKGNPEGLKKSVKTHLQYYNCSPERGPISPVLIAITASREFSFPCPSIPMLTPITYGFIYGLQL